MVEVLSGTPMVPERLPAFDPPAAFFEWAKEVEAAAEGVPSYVRPVAPPFAVVVIV